MAAADFRIRSRIPRAFAADMSIGGQRRHHQAGPMHSEIRAAIAPSFRGNLRQMQKSTPSSASQAGMRRYLKAALDPNRR